MNSNRYEQPPIPSQVTHAYVTDIGDIELRRTRDTSHLIDTATVRTHEMSLKKLLLPPFSSDRAMPAPASKMDENDEPQKSDETTASSV